jgi:hypothetical protein
MTSTHHQCQRLLDKVECLWIGFIDEAVFEVSKLNGGGRFRSTIPSKGDKTSTDVNGEMAPPDGTIHFRPANFINHHNKTPCKSKGLPSSAARFNRSNTSSAVSVLISRQQLTGDCPSPLQSR